MCILGICTCPVGTAAAAAAAAVSRRFPLIIVNNRDEYLSRPTAPFTVDADTGVACFRDGLAGGTWMGVNVHTRAFAALTNSRDSYDGRKGGESRGQLIIHALTPAAEADGQKDDGVSKSAPSPHAVGFPNEAYDGFNFVSCADLARVATGDEPLLYSSNRAEPSAAEGDGTAASGPRAVRLAAPAVHVVSNTFMDNWREPKTRFLRDALTAAIADDALAEAPIEEGLLPRLGDILCSRNCDTCLRDSGAGADGLDVAAATGVEKRYAEANHVFDAGEYDGENGMHATRTQSVVIVERRDHAAGTDGAEGAHDASTSYCVHYFVRDVNGSTRALGPWRHSVASE